MLTVPSLYSNQQALVDDGVRPAMQEVGNVILSSEPGSGKTRMSKHICACAMNKPPSDRQTGRILFAVHRRGLVDNAIDSFKEPPYLPHGVLMSSRNTDWSQRMQIGSIDTLLSWHLDNGIYTSKAFFDLVIYDECHAHLPTFARWLMAHNEARKAAGFTSPFVLGLSGTPDAKGQGDLFQRIIQGPTPQWLIEAGQLSPFRYYGGSSVEDALAGDLVRDWRLYANGRQTMGFFRYVADAKHAAELFNKHGIRAEYVDSDTKDKTRRAMLKDLDSGRLTYLANVGICERGTNVRNIGAIQLCVRIRSLARYRQIISRASRKSDVWPDAVLIDHGDNAQHGFFEDTVHWTLDHSRLLFSPHSNRPMSECPRCQRRYRGGKCWDCGYEPRSASHQASNMIFDQSQLQRRKLTAGRRKRTVKTNEQLFTEALYRAGRSGRTYRSAYGLARMEAEKQGTKFKLPRRVTVGGEVVDLIPYDHVDSGRRVADVFPRFASRKTRKAR